MTTAAITYISDSLILDHFLEGGGSPLLWQDKMAVSPTLFERHVAIMDEDRRTFQWPWYGKETDYNSLRTFWRTVRLHSFYFFYPWSEDWSGDAVACGFPERASVGGTIGGTGYVTGAFTGVSNAADAVLTVANTFTAIADNVYLYIPATGQPGCVVDSGGGGTGTLAAALNGKLHKITEYTSAAAVKIATDTSGLDTWVSGGTAALATFIIRGRSTSGHVVKEGATTKTVTTHYTIAAGEGLGDEDVIQCTDAWIPANSAAVTCGFIGRRRYLGRFQSNTLEKPHTNFTVAGVQAFKIPLNMIQLFNEC